MGFGAMAVPKPYEFIGFGAMDVRGVLPDPKFCRNTGRTYKYRRLRNNRRARPYEVMAVWGHGSHQTILVFRFVDPVPGVSGDLRGPSVGIPGASGGLPEASGTSDKQKT